MALQHDIEAAAALRESLAIEQAAVKEARDQEREDEARRKVAEYDEGNVGTAAALSNHRGLLRQLRDHTDRLFLHARHQGRTRNERNAQPSDHAQHTAAQRERDRTVSELRRERREPEAKAMLLLTREAQASYEARLWTDIADKEGELRPGSAAAREYRAYAQEAQEAAERTTKQHAREANLPTRQPPVDVPLADLLKAENAHQDVFYNKRAARYERDHVANLPPEQQVTAMASVMADQRKWVEVQMERMRLLDFARTLEGPGPLAAMMEKVAYASASESFERWLSIAMKENRYHGKTAVHADAAQHRDVANRAFEAVHGHLFGQADSVGQSDADSKEEDRDKPQYVPTSASAVSTVKASRGRTAAEKLDAFVARAQADKPPVPPTPPSTGMKR